MIKQNERKKTQISRYLLDKSSCERRTEVVLSNVVYSCRWGGVASESDFIMNYYDLLPKDGV